MAEVEVLKQFAATYGPVVDGLVETSNNHSGEIETLQTDTKNLDDDMTVIKQKVSNIEEDIATLKTNPKSIIMSENEFNELQQNVISGSMEYEENALYFTYKDEIN